MPDANPLNVTRIDHVVFRVVDMETMIGFYCEVIGCRLERGPGENGLAQLRARDLDLCRGAVADCQEGFALELQEGRAGRHLVALLVRMILLVVVVPVPPVTDVQVAPADTTLVAGDSATFAAAVFTNLGADHLDFHGTQEAYFRAKAKLFEAGRSDLAVLNIDDPRGRLLRRGARDGDQPSARRV